MSSAIEYIRQIQNAERNLHGEMQRLQRESDFARDAQKENEMLKTEIQVMHQHLRRLDANAPHVYGHFTQHLNQQQGTNGSISLPPLNAAGGSGPAPNAFTNGIQAPPAPGPMQGVEYGGYTR